MWIAVFEGVFVSSGPNYRLPGINSDLVTHSDNWISAHAGIQYIPSMDK